jgi:hypothetical protein
LALRLFGPWIDGLVGCVFEGVTMQASGLALLANVLAPLTVRGRSRPA